MSSVSNEKWRLSIAVPKDGSDGDILSVEKNGEPGFRAVLENENLMILSYFGDKEQPLLVTGVTTGVTEAAFVYRTYRIELWLDGRLVDENWPFGEPRFSYGEIADACRDLSNVCVEHFEDVTVEEPTVVGSFTGAMGWHPSDNVFVGDCMPYSHDGRYHVLYLKDRRHHGSKWGMGAHQWDHISTADLVHWDIHPMAVPIDDASEASICTGSWLEKDGLHRLYYAVRQNDWGPAPIRRSFSKDGYHYEKDRDFSVYLSDRYLQKHARDPKIIFSTDGRWHMLVTTTDLPVNKGCLAHLVSDDEQNWTELEPEITVDTSDEPECPDYFYYNGRYYILYSVKGKAHYKYSDKPFGAWVEPAEPIIDCGSVPKCAVWNDRLIFTGFTCIGGYAGGLNFLEAKADENGELKVFPVAEMQ